MRVVGAPTMLAAERFPESRRCRRAFRLQLKIGQREVDVRRKDLLIVATPGDRVVADLLLGDPNALCHGNPRTKKSGQNQSLACASTRSSPSTEILEIMCQASGLCAKPTFRHAASPMANETSTEQRRCWYLELCRARHLGRRIRNPSRHGNMEKLRKPCVAYESHMHKQAHT